MSVPILHIAIAFDKNYLTPFHALLASILSNGKENSFHFHVIATGITDSQKSEIVTYVNDRQSEITFYAIDQELVGRFVLSGKWTPAVYYRLFFPLLVPDYLDKILYLDSDIIVVGDLMELYSEDVRNYAVGAVYDNYVKKQERIGLTEEGNYFNSGVLLINMKAWRSQQISEKAIAYLQEHPENILFVDQCALNAVLIRKWKKLPERYNLLYSYVPTMLGRRAMKEFIEDKIVIHYTLQRPWHMLCENRLRSYYFYYLQQANIKFNRYNDFQIIKIPTWLSIRIKELYSDFSVVRTLWKLLKH